MNDEIITAPDLGVESAKVIEIIANKGDTVAVEDPLIAVESDKASVEIPASSEGVVAEVLVKIGDDISQGTPLIKLQQNAESSAPSKAHSEDKTDKKDSNGVDSAGAVKIAPVVVPDIGAEDVPVIEVLVKVGDRIAKEDSMITLESDKASMEVPAPFSGMVKEISVKVGDTLNTGDLILMLETGEAGSVAVPEPATTKKESSQSVTKKTAPSTTVAADSSQLESKNKNLHAGPAVRKIAREFGVDLTLINGTGPANRILKEDIQTFVKSRLQGSTALMNTGGALVAAPVPAIDFSKWGEIDIQPLTRLREIAAQNFQSSWSTVPHVTQFDEADITELEVFRKERKPEAEKRGTKLTPLPFILKACAVALKEIPQVCSSLSPDGKSTIYKKYVHIGIAVDTPDGLMVPVIKNVDQKGLWELSEECIELATKARLIKN